MTDFNEVVADSRRIRILPVSADLLAEMFGCGTGRSTAREHVHDLRIIHADVMAMTGEIRFSVWSKSFDPVPEGEQPPVWQQTLESEYCPECGPAFYCADEPATENAS